MNSAFLGYFPRLLGCISLEDFKKVAELCYLTFITLLLQLFREEVLIIQKRHAIVFPPKQLFYIRAEKVGEEFELKFLKGYDLATVITMEIQLAFKLVFGKFENGRLQVG